MSTYTTTYDIAQLMTDFQSCAQAAGFCTVKFGPPDKINFDHNICYDLLNIEYPTSYIAEGVDEVYTFNLTIARPTTKATTQGVQTFDTDVVNIFAALEVKLWNLLSCLALGISGGGNCSKHIPKHKIQIVRNKNLYNDNLVTLQVKFDAIANIAATVDPCNDGSGGDGCDHPCAPFFGACGCTDPLAVNYNPNAGVDDGTCCYGAAETPCVDEDPTFPPTYPLSQTSNPS